jgi:HEAT repeat protein
VPYLILALKRDDRLIVQRVCSSLGDIADSSAVQPLLEVCTDTSWHVRDQAIGALGRIGDAAAAEQIGAALSDTIGQVRKSAAVSVGRMQLMQYCAALVPLLGDDFYGARMSARHSLLRFDTMIVIAAIADSLESPNRLVGSLGCMILGELGTDPAMDLLLRQTRSSEPARRAQAAVALVKADPLDNCNYRRLFVA